MQIHITGGHVYPRILTHAQHLSVLNFYSQLFDVLFSLSSSVAHTIDLTQNMRNSTSAAFTICKSREHTSAYTIYTHKYSHTRMHAIAHLTHAYTAHKATSHTLLLFGFIQKEPPLPRKSSQSKSHAVSILLDRVKWYFSNFYTFHGFAVSPHFSLFIFRTPV